MKRIAAVAVFILGMTSVGFATAEAPPAPEIDSSSFVTASALVCSILLMARGGRKERTNLLK